ncbi:hypothetical protein [Oceanobacillus neutriphilus]|uniref:DUF1640 domain-containing protein n=1 Tax=Oceanobacillus neutriphilus TaxID=531815 RepID=A0ABQ2P1W3_9BACI|nr:hypothetical protein [Oceanobacillus neutriphilus]GGP16205.1 hypothetical protein GCM10011346_47250 [Oceanobacillus neutriphilus]
MDTQKDVEDMEKFMNVLMEVKVSLAEQSGKLDNLLDMKERMNETYDIAKGARNKANELEKDIQEIKAEMKDKASIDDVEREVKRRENLMTHLPTWLAVGISLAVFVLNYVINS